MNSSYMQSENRAVDAYFVKTLDDVRKCVSDLTAVRGLATVVNLLRGYSATRICEVPEQHFDDFVGHCERLMSNQD